MTLFQSIRRFFDPKPSPYDQHHVLTSHELEAIKVIQAREKEDLRIRQQILDDETRILERRVSRS